MGTIDPKLEMICTGIAKYLRVLDQKTCVNAKKRPLKVKNLCLRLSQRVAYEGSKI